MNGENPLLVTNESVEWETIGSSLKLQEKVSIGLK